LFGIGEKSDAKYEEDTKEVINQVREVLDFPMGADGREQSIEKTRALTNEWVARYRRSGDYSGRPSYGLTYSALNAVSGHFNNFGTKYPFPAKRKDRVFEELTSAETQISRGRLNKRERERFIYYYRNEMKKEGREVLCICAYNNM